MPGVTEVEAPVLKFTTVFNTSTTNLLTSSYIHLKVGDSLSTLMDCGLSFNLL